MIDGEEDGEMRAKAADGGRREWGLGFGLWIDSPGGVW